jgi:predicted nucleic acid-binding protein
LIVRFAGRILPVEIDVAQRWGRIRALAARPLPVIDSLLAATAQQHNLTLVTRNVEDVRGTGVAVFNPWPVR